MSNPPRRRQSAAVYRRRRIVVFGGLLVIVLAAVLLIWRPWSQGGGSQTPPPTTPPTTPPATAPATTGTTPTGDPTFEAADPNAPAPACDPAHVTVTALTDKGEYNAEEQPRLSLSLTNGSDADCTIDVGTAHQSFTITSGSDTWWRSTDCQNNPTSQLVTLKAGQTATSAAPLIWDRTRSSAETCNDETRPRAGGGGATYHLSVEVGGITSQSTAQFLLY